MERPWPNRQGFPFPGKFLIVAHVVAVPHRRGEEEDGRADTGGDRAGPVRLAHDQKYVGNALEPPLVLPRACHYSYAIDALLDLLNFPILAMRS